MTIDEKLGKLPKVVPTAFRDKITGKYVFRCIYLQCDLSRTDVWIYYKPAKGNFPFLLAVGQTFEMALVRGTKRNVYGCKWKVQKYKELGDGCLKRNARNG